MLLSPGARTVKTEMLCTVSGVSVSVPISLPNSGIADYGISKDARARIREQPSRLRQPSVVLRQGRAATEATSHPVCGRACGEVSHAGSSSTSLQYLCYTSSSVNASDLS